MLYVSHDVNEVARVADRAVMIKNGGIANTLAASSLGAPMGQARNMPIMDAS